MTHAEPHEPVGGHPPIEDILGRAARVWIQHRDSLQDCECRLGELMNVRVEHQWSHDEHTQYLRLRRKEQRLLGRMQRARRVFDRARAAAWKRAGPTSFQHSDNVVARSHT